MKNARPLLVILISVLAGAAAVVVAARWVAQRARIATTKVVVASRDLEVGTRLRADMLRVVDWPASLPLKEPVSDPRTIFDRVINTQVLRGEPIVATKLAPRGEKGGLSAVLDPGKRAITVRVNEIVGVAGFALPGNYVDVMVNAPDESNRPVSKIVLQRILVLAVAQDISTSETKARVVNAVTLEVTPQQAEQIDLARSIGSLSLVLRSQSDKSSVATSGARKSNLLEPERLAMEKPLGKTERPMREAAARPVVKPRPSTVRNNVPAAKRVSEQLEVIRGLKKSLE